MRKHSARRANRTFLFGVSAMAILVILVALLFYYWCLPVPDPVAP